jgi:hypothetical protein
MRWKGGERKSEEEEKRGIRRAISDALLNINDILKHTAFPISRSTSYLSS